MAYASKAEQRIAGSTNYASSASKLTSNSVSGPGQMKNSKDSLVGKLASGSPKTLVGKTSSREGSSGLTGRMSGGGYQTAPVRGNTPRPKTPMGK